MQITEKDIFYYVFYPNKLETVKKNYIKYHEDSFKKELILCESTKKIEEKKIPENILREIYKRIESYSSTNEIYLTKVKSKVPREQYLTLAAAGENDKPFENYKVETFVDEGNQCLAKVINYPDRRKIYIFNKNNEVMNGFNLELFPSGLKFENINNKEALSVEPGTIIESIKITFIN